MAVAACAPLAHAGEVIKIAPTSGLVSYWAFDGNKINWTAMTAADSSGNGNTGTISNMTASGNTVNGKVGQALLFDGSSASVGLASNPLSSMANQNSVCAWAKTSDLTSESGLYNQTIIDLFTNNSNGMRMGSVYNSGVFFVMYKANGSVYGTQSVVQIFNNNVWVNVCYVWDGGGITLYANGISIATTTGSDSVGSPSTIGAKNNGGDGTWKGPLDDIRIYSRALTAAEIMRIYQAGAATIDKVAGGKAKIDVAPTSFLNSGLVGYWPFDGKTVNWSTGQATDSSGNGNTGTLVNMSTTTSPVIGKIGQALSFNGSTSYVSVPQTTALNFSSTGIYTWSTWLMYSSISGNQCYLSQDPFNATKQTGFNLCLQASAGSTADVVICNYATAVDSVMTCSAGLSLGLVKNQWTNIVVIYDGASHWTVYQNGVNKNAMTFSVTSAAVKYFIGAGQKANTSGGVQSPGAYFSGSIDDVRVYNRALSAAEVKQLYLMGK